MQKIYVLLILGIFSATMVYSQPATLIDRQPVEKQLLLLPGPMKENISSVVQPLSTDAPLFEFDSLNVSYQGSWGFGQSFSISSASSGDIVFMGSGAGVIILDVTIPADPVKISEISTRGLVDAIYYDETAERLYLCAYFAGFEIWDVSDLSAPVKLGGAPTTGLPRGGIYADGNIVYVVTVVDGIQIFDVTIPSDPIQIGACSLGLNKFAWTSAKSGNLIFAALGDGGMKVVDVSDPANPAIAGSYGGVTTGVWVADSYAYVTSYNYGMSILDISDLSNISQVGNCAIPGYPYRVQVQGNYAYVGNATSAPDGGIYVVDVSVPANPQVLPNYPAYAEHITVNGDVLAFTGTGNACTILDISVPAIPVLASTYSIPVLMADMEVEGNLAYTGNNGFRIFDVSDKTKPVQIGYDPTDGAIVRLAGNLAVYIRESMTANNPVMIMDVSDPTMPDFMGQYMSPVMTNDLEVRDHYAFVACWWDGFRVIDFQDPTHPVIVAHKMGWFQNAVPGEDFCYVQALDIEGNYIYLIDYEPFSGEDTRGLYILDISDPTNPVFVSRFTDFVSGGYDIDVVGNFVYVADMNGGVEVIDVTDKLNPVARGYTSIPDVGNGIKVAENHAFVAAYINGGVQVINVADPDNIFVDGYYTPSGCFALGVTIEGNDIFLVDGAAGFQIYTTTLITGVPQQGVQDVSISRAFPNPFRDKVEIEIAGTLNDTGSLTICDAFGRYIVTLQPRKENTGFVTYLWDGTTATGAKAAPGFYYFKTATGKANGKLVKSER